MARTLSARSNAECHPERSHYARGKCRACYRKQYNDRHINGKGNQAHIAERERFFLEQQGRCAICNVPQSQVKKPFSLDHDHKTGKNRGLLCVCCNTALGSLREDPALVHAALAYLEKHNQVT